MSILNDEFKVFAGVLATKLSDNTATPVRNSVISATIRDSGITDGIMAGMLNGLGARAHRFRNYADDPEKFPPGLMTGTIGVASNDGSGGYSEESEVPGLFYPIVNYRRDGEFLTKENDAERHAYTKKLLKRVALRLDNIVSAYENDDRKNPDGTPVEGENPVQDLDDCYFMFAIDLYSLEEQTAVYMYHFWKMMEGLAPISEADHNYNTSNIGEDVGQNRSLPNNSLRFSNEEDYEVDIQFNFITSDSESGELVNGDGKKVDGFMDVITGTIESETIQYENGSEATIFWDTSIVVMKWQSAPGTIEVVTVQGLTHETNVHAYGEETRVSRSIYSNQDSNIATYNTYYGLDRTSPDFGRSAFYFPLHIDTLEMFKTNPEEEILTDAMLLVMHAAQAVELEWYQQGWFKIIMVIIIAVIVYFSLGSIGLEALSSFSNFATAVLSNLGIAFLIDLVLKEVGGELGVILAVAAAAWAASKGNFSQVNKLMPHAKEMLQVVQVVARVEKAIIKRDSLELIEDSEAFLKDYNDRQEEYREAYAALHSDDPETDINYYELTRQSRYSFNLNESADQFFARAKTTTVAPFAKEAISLYHSRMKELPRIEEDHSFALA